MNNWRIENSRGIIQWDKLELFESVSGKNEEWSDKICQLLAGSLEKNPLQESLNFIIFQIDLFEYSNSFIVCKYIFKIIRLFHFKSLAWFVSF